MPLLIWMDLSEEERLTVTRLFERYGDALYVFARSFLRDPFTAEEAVQDAFLELVAKPKRMKERTAEELRSYLYAAVRTHAIRAYRKRRREAPATENDLAERLGELPDANETVDAIASAVISPRLDGIIDGLSPAAQEVLYLKYGDDRTNGEIAERLGISYNAVSARLSRAYAELRNALEKGGEPV